MTDTAARWASYVRASTKEQKDSGPRQLLAINAWAKRHGYSIKHRFADIGVSGHMYFADRPGSAALMEAVTDGQVNRVIVDDFTRLGRDAVDSLYTLSRLQRDYDCRVYILGTNSNSSLLLPVDMDDMASFTFAWGLALVAQVSNINRLSSAQRGRDRKRAMGRVVGIPPKFYKSVDGMVVPDFSQRHRVMAILDGFSRGLPTKTIRKMSRVADSTLIKIRDRFDTYIEHFDLVDMGFEMHPYHAEKADPSRVKQVVVGA
uniref:Putative resolvase domain containing protein n=1 Tax=viral metagenome TaxID=1070528 RepID=A0A6M3IDR2_9ZZZZ